MASKNTTHTLPAQGGRELRVRQTDDGTLLATYYCTDTDGNGHVAPEFPLASALVDPQCPITAQAGQDFFGFMIGFCDDEAGFTDP